MLRGASAWGHRGWLIMLGTRRQGVAQAIDAASAMFSPSTRKRWTETKATPIGVGLANDDVDDVSAQTIVRDNSNVTSEADVSLEITVTAGGPGDDTRG